jgi:enoyl-CoA hydratase
MTNSSSLLIETDGPCVTFTLNRPDKLNALNAELLRELAEAFRSIEDARPRTVIITGAGKAFSAGVDIGEMAAMSTPDMRWRRSSRR